MRVARASRQSVDNGGLSDHGLALRAATLTGTSCLTHSRAVFGPDTLGVQRSCANDRPLPMSTDPLRCSYLWLVSSVMQPRAACRMLGVTILPAHRGCMLWRWLTGLLSQLHAASGRASETHAARAQARPASLTSHGSARACSCYIVALAARHKPDLTWLVTCCVQSHSNQSLIGAQTIQHKLG